MIAVWALSRYIKAYIDLGIWKYDHGATNAVKNVYLITLRGSRVNYADYLPSRLLISSLMAMALI